MMAVSRNDPDAHAESDPYVVSQVNCKPHEILNPTYTGQLPVTLPGTTSCQVCAQQYLRRDCLVNDEVKQCRACPRPRLFFISKDFEYEAEYSDDEANAKLDEGEAKLRAHVLGVLGGREFMAVQR
jgi:hypothetical protein